MKIKGYWPSLAFVIALVVIALIFRITDAEVWCEEEDPVRVCVRDWFDVFGSIAVAIAAAIIAALQLKVSVRQTNLPLMENKLKLAFKIRNICSSHIKAFSAIPDKTTKLINNTENYQSFDDMYEMLPLLRSDCFEITKHREYLNVIIDEGIIDYDIASIVHNVSSLNLELYDDAIELVTLLDSIKIVSNPQHNQERAVMYASRIYIPKFKYISDVAPKYLEAFNKLNNEIQSIINDTSSELQNSV